MKLTRVTILLPIAAALLCVAFAAQQFNLPAPFATPSANNSARVIPKPEAAQLKVPAGFTVSVYADNLQGPRTMLYAPNGDLFVAQIQIAVMKGHSKNTVQTLCVHKAGEVSVVVLIPQDHN